jgi:hypothetical protein
LAFFFGLLSPVFRAFCVGWLDAEFTTRACDAEGSQKELA